MRIDANCDRILIEQNDQIEIKIHRRMKLIRDEKVQILRYRVDIWWITYEIVHNVMSHDLDFGCEAMLSFRMRQCNGACTKVIDFALTMTKKSKFLDTELTFCGLRMKLFIK